MQQLSDGTLIVMHDSNFKRTTGEDICVWDAEADALKTLEVGSGFSAAYRGEQIPTLEEMLACARGRITLMIELKYTGQEDALEESVLTLLQDYDMVDECIIGSMNKGILQKMNGIYHIHCKISPLDAIAVGIVQLIILFFQIMGNKNC